MKVRLTSSKDTIEGYQNISPDGIKNFLDNECKHIFCDNVLRFISFSMIDIFIKDVVSKLRKDAELIVSDLDIDIVMLLYTEREIEEKELNQLLSPSYGFYNSKFIKDKLIQAGLTVEEAKISGNYFYIKAKRSV